MTVQAIIYTAHQQEWRALVAALGLDRVGDASDTWEEHGAHGVLAIHGAEDGSPKAGGAETHLLINDVDGLINRLTAGGVAHTVEDDDVVGRVVVARDDQGVSISASAGDSPHTDGPLVVMPLQFTPNVESATALYTACGLTPRVVADAGGWVDFTADGGGMAALHRGDATQVELSFEYRGNIDDLANRLRRFGYEPVVVDESYNKTLEVMTPDRGMLGINEVQTDLHGYSLVSSDRSRRKWRR